MKTLCIKTLNAVFLLFLWNTNAYTQTTQPTPGGEKITPEKTEVKEAVEKPTTSKKSDVEEQANQEKDPSFSDIQLEESGELYYIDMANDGTLIFRPNGTQSDQLLILDDDNDNVTAEVVGNGGFRVNGNDAGDTRFSMTNGGGNHYLFDDDDGGHALKVESANDFAINTGGVNERMRIDAAGRSSINTDIFDATQLYVNSDWAWCILGNNSLPDMTTYGVYGVANGSGTGTRYGVYGSASGGDTRWAGFFTGNTYTSRLTVGGLDLATNYELSVHGEIACEELLIDDDAFWPDYVFEDDYELLSIDEFAKSIDTNGHLPGIPSAKEIEENGIQVGDMQRRTMEKVEELSLYIIQLHERMKALESENEALKNQLKSK